LRVTTVVAVALEPELLQVSVKVVVDLTIPALRDPVAPSFEAFNPPPVIAQEVGFAAVVDALQDNLTTSSLSPSPSVVLGFAVNDEIVTGCVTVTVTGFDVAVAVIPPNELLQASVYATVA
jgi:hypothetical protein